MKIASRLIFITSLCMASEKFCNAQNNQRELWKSREYVVFKDSIVQQQKYVAKAISATEIISNYQSPFNLYQSPLLTFKFSINGKDNEMKPGIDHHFNCDAATNEIPLIEFGKACQLLTVM